MAEGVDPADAAPAGYASGDSIATCVACKTGAPIVPRCVVTEAIDLSPGRRIAYRAEGVGWLKTSIEKCAVLPGSFWPGSKRPLSRTWPS
eukprot:8478293-Pyramimonas_sp.AAC.1